MTERDRGEFKRMILRVERDLFSQSPLKKLLVAAGATLAANRPPLRAVKARSKRSRK